MKGIALFALCLAPTLAFGQQTYTNADLSKFHVPGAYTNEDLKRLPPLPAPKATTVVPPRVELPTVDSAQYQVPYDSLKRSRAALVAEIEIEKRRIDESESGFAGDTASITDRLGYRSRAASLVRELQKLVLLMDARMDIISEDARKAGADLDRR